MTDSNEPARDDRIYPCQKCGAMRSKAEGGTTFTVCDECWDETMAPAPAGEAPSGTVDLSDIESLPKLKPHPAIAMIHRWAKEDAEAGPAPLSDEELAYIRERAQYRGADGERSTGTPDGQWEWIDGLLATVDRWKERAEEAERERDEFLCQAHGAWNPECLGCVVEQAEEVDRQLSNIRSRLGGSPEDRLDGDDGLVARLLKESAESLDALNAIGGLVGLEVGGLYAELPQRVAQLREENERLKEWIDNKDPGHAKHRSRHISDALGIEDESTTKQVEAIEQLTKERDELGGILASLADAVNSILRDENHHKRGAIGFHNYDTSHVLRDEIKAYAGRMSALREKKRALEEALKRISADAITFGQHDGPGTHVALETVTRIKDVARAALKGGE